MSVVDWTSALVDETQAEFCRYAAEAIKALDAIGVNQGRTLAIDGSIFHQHRCQNWVLFLSRRHGNPKLHAQVSLQDDGEDPYPVTRLYTYIKLPFRTASQEISVSSIYPDELKELVRFERLLMGSVEILNPQADKLLGLCSSTVER